MSKGSGGSLSRGRRHRNEVPPAPDASHLTPAQADAQLVLLRQVEQAGGRFDSTKPVPVDYIDLLARLFEERAHDNGVPADEGTYFNGRPGLWHALDELVPLQDPNRWDQLRKAVIEELELHHGWRRRAHPRGAGFDLPP